MIQIQNYQKALLDDYALNKPEICGTIPSVPNPNPAKEKLSCLFWLPEYQETSTSELNQVLLHYFVRREFRSRMSLTLDKEYVADNHTLQAAISLWSTIIYVYVAVLFSAILINFYVADRNVLLVDRSSSEVLR
jgi:hypothetical protein